jgi:hypothetical protein
LQATATAATTEFQVTLMNVETNARHAPRPATQMGGGAIAEQLLLYGRRLRIAEGNFM